MPTTNPRINVVLEKPVYEGVARLAKRDGVSLSLKVRDLVREAMETDEDVALAKVAEKREKSFKKYRALRHNEIW
ncbi:MAG: toxin-antitoxin system, antitoxin component [Nitrospinae bacterium]|nr:toxin-antitoxin system, antitoxin component [Nitrospinota bacterium]